MAQSGNVRGKASTAWHLGMVAALVAAALALGGAWGGGSLRALGAPDTAPAPAVACSLEASGATTQPARLPVVVELTLTNTGWQSLNFWSGGPAEYPGAEHFEATVIAPGGAGKPRTLECFNGQYQAGSGIDHEIKPGTSMKVPLTLAPLAAGEYDIIFTSREAKWTDPKWKVEKTLWPAAQAGALHVTIKEDAKLADAVQEDWVRRVLGGEPLAERTAAQWKTPGVITKLVPALTGDDDKAAFNAAGVLWHLDAPDLPAGTGAATAKGIEKWLQPRRGSEGLGAALLIYLAMVAGNVGSDEALAGVLKLTHGDTDSADAHDEVRWRAVQNLARFRQPQVAGELRALTKRNNTMVRSAAAIALAERADTAAVPVLVELIAKEAEFRAYQVQALAHFPHDPRAVAAIEGALKDPDALVRDFAERALKKVAKVEAEAGAK